MSVEPRHDQSRPAPTTQLCAQNPQKQKVGSSNYASSTKLLNLLHSSISCDVTHLCLGPLRESQSRRADAFASQRSPNGGCWTRGRATRIGCNRHVFPPPEGFPVPGSVTADGTTCSQPVCARKGIGALICSLSCDNHGLVSPKKDGRLDEDVRFPASHGQPVGQRILSRWRQRNEPWKQHPHHRPKIAKKPPRTPIQWKDVRVA